jgi:hypothetical protein
VVAQDRTDLGVVHAGHQREPATATAAA